jgi:mannose-6-phosphate isomerase-like protein (cupin superfamily)
MNEQNKYNINLDVMYEHQELIDIPSIVNSVTEKWSNRTLTQVNDSVVRIGIVEGEFHWHKHDNDDEFFFVLSGTLCIDVRDDKGERTIELNPNQGVTISRGVMHRPRAPQKTVILMVETSDIKPTGD